MHDYLRALGIDEDSGKKIVTNMIKETKEEIVNGKLYAGIKEQKQLVEKEYDVFFDAGVKLVGETIPTKNAKMKFEEDHYFPYITGDEVSMEEDLIFSKKVDTKAYSVMCEDPRAGISLVFYLQNVLDYEIYKKDKLKGQVMVCFSGLSLEGKILLPGKTKELDLTDPLNVIKMRGLIKAAKNGDVSAMENLTLDELDLNTKVSERSMKEDIFTIVNTSIMPHGAEADSYKILGNIEGFKLEENSVTKRKVYVLDLEVNGIKIKVAINKNDLEGEPLVGRRFYGVIWLQGYIDF